MVTYYKPWDYYNRKDIDKAELGGGAGIFNATISKSSNNQVVTVEALDRVCTFSKVQPFQVMEQKGNKTAK